MLKRPKKIFEQCAELVCFGVRHSVRQLERMPIFVVISSQPKEGS